MGERGLGGDVMKDSAQRRWRCEDGVGGEGGVGRAAERERETRKENVVIGSGKML